MDEEGLSGANVDGKLHHRISKLQPLAGQFDTKSDQKPFTTHFICLSGHITHGCILLQRRKQRPRQQADSYFVLMDQLSGTMVIAQ
jgi:hypothetical protein